MNTRILIATAAVCISAIPIKSANKEDIAPHSDGMVEFRGLNGQSFNLPANLTLAEARCSLAVKLNCSVNSIKIAAGSAIAAGEGLTLLELIQYLEVKMLTVIKSVPLLERIFDPEDPAQVGLIVDFVNGFRDWVDSQNQIVKIAHICEGDLVGDWRSVQIQIEEGELENLWIKKEEEIVQIQDFALVYQTNSLCRQIQFICEKLMIQGYHAGVDLNGAFELRSLEDLRTELSSFLEFDAI